MTKVLLTAFEPYDRWTANASWLALIELTRELPATPQLTTRRYPVDFSKTKQQLLKDLSSDEFDYAIHLGQAPGSGRIRFESISLNVGGGSHESPDDCRPLVPAGPVAYRSTLPLADWAKKLRGSGIPAQVSYHAGTFLCNAILYLSQHTAWERGLKTRSAFIHLPLAPGQVMDDRQDTASLPTSMVAAGLRMVLAELA